MALLRDAEGGQTTTTTADSAGNHDSSAAEKRSRSSSSCHNHEEIVCSENSVRTSAFHNSTSPMMVGRAVKPPVHQNGDATRDNKIGGGPAAIQLHQNGTCGGNASSSHASSAVDEDGAGLAAIDTHRPAAACVPHRCVPNPRATGSPKHLLKLQDVPRHLQFNPYILTGYRHQMRAKECIASLKQFHNETINILTHGLPFVFGMLYMPFLLPWEDIKIPILPYAHAAGVVAPWFGSSLYHLFMNHHSGEDLYRQLLKWDVVGVWVTQSFGALTTICAGLYHTPSFFTAMVIILYMGLSLRAFTDTVFARGPWQRRMGFGLLFAIRTAVFLFRLTPYGGGHPQALVHVFLQDAWSAVGAVISAVRIPERWAPGWFDYAFNSHNIMHVLVVLAAVHMHWAAEKDLMWLNERATKQALMQ